jgi:hypothetical protein
VLLALLGGFHADAQVTALALDAGNLKTGRFLYRTLQPRRLPQQRLRLGQGGLAIFRDVALVTAIG